MSHACYLLSSFKSPASLHHSHLTEEVIRVEPSEGVELKVIIFYRLFIGFEYLKFSLGAKSEQMK